MMDYYLEFVFPEKQIRYIAVAENEDTEKGTFGLCAVQESFQRMVRKGYQSQGENGTPC